MVVIGYSAAQANHLTCVESSHVSVQPFNSPSTARPATSQRELVSLSTNGADAFLRSSVNVSGRSGASGCFSRGDTPSAFGRGAVYFPGGHATGKYADAVRDFGSHRITRFLPS